MIERIFESINDGGASVTELYGNEPIPELRTQDLWPCSCMGWPICVRYESVLC